MSLRSESCPYHCSKNSRPCDDGTQTFRFFFVLTWVDRLIDRIYRRNTSLRKVFRSFDPDHSGEIDHEELKQAVINLLPGQRPNAEVLQLLCDIMDRTEDFHYLFRNR